MRPADLIVAAHLAIEVADDVDDQTRRQVNLHDRASLRDVHMRRKVIEGVEPDFVYRPHE